MATTSTSALFTRSWVLSNARGTPKRLLAALADSRRLVDSAVISKSSGSDFKAGMCACAAQPRSGLAPMMPTRILLGPFWLMVVFLFPWFQIRSKIAEAHRGVGAADRRRPNPGLRSRFLVEHVAGDLPAIRAPSENEELPVLLGPARSRGHNGGGARRVGPRIGEVALHRWKGGSGNPVRVTASQALQQAAAKY